MTIPESQLQTWSHQGAVAQSRDTYAAVKRALESPDSSYSGRAYTVFLQGSYANDTNVYAESDVDIVIRADAFFQYDISSINQTSQNAFHAAYENATYTYTNFKSDVTMHLLNKFNSSVSVGRKAIKIRGHGNRRNCDVLVSGGFRHYNRFECLSDQNYLSGIDFYTQDNRRIVNFPRQHSENCTRKHQLTNQTFKGAVRVVKNMRNHLVSHNMLGHGVAPSYFIESLLYNVPNEIYNKNLQSTIIDGIAWVYNSDKAQLTCANELLLLFGDDSDVSWSMQNYNQFLDALACLWDNWQ